MRRAQRPWGRRKEYGPLLLTALPGVGPELARKFAELDVRSTADLLAYIPRDYKDWRRPLAIADLKDGEEAIVVGKVARVQERPGRFALVQAEIEDDTGTLTVKWFGRKHLFGAFEPGMRLFVAGRVARTRRLLLEMNATNHKVLRDDDGFVGEIVPVYPASKELTTRQIRTTIARNLPRLIADSGDALPEAIAQRYDLPPLDAAWREVHAPHSLEALGPARRRIVFQEFFGIALATALKRARRAATGGARAMSVEPQLLATFEGGLPFALTAAQRRVIEEIWHDMTRTSAMNRLLQGDVGSGKTLVAAAAIVLAARNGVQSALMAPTEILAAQHARKLAPLLMPHGIAVEALFGSLGARERRGALARIGTGEAALAVGTHALLTDTVEFARLGLAIIDEQHRFGVEQRAKLRSKSVEPHTLHMTATPIPRSLAQTKYADFDLSIIDELPPGRTPIETFVLRASRKREAYEFVRYNVRLGRQAYVVAPAIDESETALTSALAEADRLREKVFPELRVEVLHGRMHARDKERVMGEFSRGESDVLIATTVVEVGVDVPNASVMVILDAHRYGLAQLHQLRGRVGRGVERSFCIVVAPDDAADIPRLEVFAGTTDGFKIAEEDLRLRREGEFAGTAQAGSGSGMIGSIVSDFELYMKAKEQADAIVSRDPELRQPEHAKLPALVDAVATARAMLVSS